MAEKPPETWLTKVSDWLVPLVRRHRVRFGIYVTLIAGFWIALATLTTALDAFLPPFPKSQVWKRNWLAVGVGLGVPTLAILLAEGLPALRQRSRDRRLSDWGLQGTAGDRYFRLTPYERKDRGRFRRADQAEVHVLGWLREAKPAVLYLTGRSGVGKSSLLNAAVLPALEEGTPAWSVVTVRTFGDAAVDLSAALRRPGPVYKQPPNDLPDELLPLLRRVDGRLKERDEWLVIVLDQFEESMILHDRDPERQGRFCSLLADLDREPLERVRLLLSLLDDYLGDVDRLGLPRLHQGHNWMQVDAFTEPAARDFLQAGFGGEGVGEELIAAVVRYAAELEEVRGKVRPIVLNMIGEALSVRSGQAGRSLGPREAQRLMQDHVRDGLKDPLVRDHAPQVLGKMVTLGGKKEPPASATEIATRTGLGLSLVRGCLIRLTNLGFVRTFDSDREGSPGTQLWEVSHDFVAHMLSLILPALQPSLGRRVRPALGPALLVAGIAVIVGLVRLQPTRTQARLEAVEQLQDWAGKYEAETRRLGDGMFGVSFNGTMPPLDSVTAIRADCSGFASLIGSLNLRGNGLTELPPEVGKLTALRELNLGGNRLMGLPPEVGKLTALSDLYLDNNALTGLPVEATTLTALRTLDLSDNRLMGLPPEVGKLTALTTLNLSNNGLTGLPVEVTKLTALRELNLGGNRLTSLPPEVGKMTALRTLDLGGNRLSDLPIEVGKMTALTVLNLSGNRLTGLPVEVTKMTALRDLYLGGNRLKSLPVEVTKLTALTKLHHNNNDLTSLPPEVGKMTALRELYLSNNGLTGLSVEITKLTALRNLYLGGNRLTGLPAEVTKLTALRTLDLSGNRLTSLPPEVGKLTALTALNLNDNGLTSLPPEICHLKALEDLQIGGNPLVDPPPSVVKRGRRAILAYLRSKLAATGADRKPQ